jgi:hypothetical protein
LRGQASPQAKGRELQRWGADNGNIFGVFFQGQTVSHGAVWGIDWHSWGMITFHFELGKRNLVFFLQNQKNLL